jgi:hypothetical protein
MTDRRAGGSQRNRRRIEARPPYQLGRSPAEQIVSTASRQFDEAISAVPEVSVRVCVR